MYVMRSTWSNQSVMQRSSKTKQFVAGIYLLDCQPRAPPDSVDAAYPTLFTPTSGNPPFSLPHPRLRPLSRFSTSARPPLSALHSTPSTPQSNPFSLPPKINPPAKFPGLVRISCHRQEIMEGFYHQNTCRNRQKRYSSLKII